MNSSDNLGGRTEVATTTEICLVRTERINAIGNSIVANTHNGADIRVVGKLLAPRRLHVVNNDTTGRVTGLHPRRHGATPTTTVNPR